MDKESCYLCGEKNLEDPADVMHEKEKSIICCLICLANNDYIKPLCLRHWTYTIGDNPCRACEIETILTF